MATDSSPSKDAVQMSDTWWSFLLQLNFVIEQPDLLTRLEGRQSNVRTTITAERVSQRAVTTAADLALDSKVNLCQVAAV